MLNLKRSHDLFLVSYFFYIFIGIIFAELFVDRFKQEKSFKETGDTEKNNPILFKREESLYLVVLFAWPIILIIKALIKFTKLRKDS